MMGFLGATLDSSLKPAEIRQTLSQAVTLGIIMTSALMIWKGLMYFTGSESPVVVVLSESMEPGFKRVSTVFIGTSKCRGLESVDWSKGDILFLHMNKDPIRAGDIVVFNIDGRDIPIVHRVVEVDERRGTGEVNILTKGDNNDVDDRIMYARGQHWLQQQHIMGRAVGYLPYIGYLTIIMTDKPVIKYILIGALGLFALTSKD